MNQFADKPIVVPIDFSDEATGAVDQACKSRGGGIRDGDSRGAAADGV
jgi:hypothetical protein